MTSQAVYDAITTYFDAQGFGLTRLDTDNPARMNPPSPPAPFVILDFPANEIEQESIGAPGGNIWRERGAFTVTVFVEAGTGGDAARGYVTAIFNAFRGQNISGVECQGMTSMQDEPDVKGNWWGYTFGIEFYYDSHG